MKRSLILLFAASLSCSVYAEEKPETRFLIPDKQIFAEDFEAETALEKPTWYLRKSDWIVEDGVLRGTNRDGNGPFIRLQSEENDGPLPEDYIMTFSFKIEENAKEKKSNKHHETRSSGHRFSFGHYAAKYQWRPETGMELKIGHGDALVDGEFYVEKATWYYATAEIRGDELLVWFKDGPAYFMQHDHFRHKPGGWEFFTHISETGFLDNLQVWSLADGERDTWPKLKAEIADAKRAFLSSDNPDFIITKEK